MNSDLYDHPTLYDVLFPVGPHLPYYAELARQASGDILELACGTGQLTLPLASAGLRIAELRVYLAANLGTGVPQKKLLRNVDRRSAISYNGSGGTL